MKEADAIGFMEDGKDLPEDTNLGEEILLAMASFKDEHGDIRCLICGRPNECCDCQVDDVKEYMQHHPVPKREERRNGN